MLSVTIDEIQRDPLKYLYQVEAGETLIIVRADREHVTLLGRKIKPSKHVLLLRRIYWLLKFSQKG